MNKHLDLSDYPQDEQQSLGGRVEPVVSSLNYEFTDGDIDYMTEKGKLFVEVDPDRGIWAQIRKEDVEFMMGIFGLK